MRDKKHHFHPSVIVLACLFAMLAAHPVVAAKGEAGARDAREAAEQVRRQTKGRVLSVKEDGRGYQVKVLTPAGEVRSVRVPQKKGR